MGKSIVPLVVGLVLFTAAGALAIWNERRAGAEADLRSLVHANVIEAASGQADPALDGRILRVAGKAHAEGAVLEPALGQAVPVLRLDRIVETAQWQERQEISQGGRDLFYELVWSATRIDSTRFRDGGGAHPNPPLRLESAQFLAPSPRLGAWSADLALWHAIPATDQPSLPARLDLADLGPVTRAGAWWWSGNPERPASGDIRLRYRAVPLGVVTLIGQAASGHLAAISGRQGEQRLALAASGDVPVEQMVGDAGATSTVEAWKVRALTLGVFLLGGFILAFALKKLTPELLDGFGGIPSLGGLVGLLLWLAVSLLAWLLIRFR